MLEFLSSHVSYLGIIVVLVLTGTGLPIPEELVVGVAGWAAANGQLNSPWLAFASCLVGALGGDCLLYWIGYHFGYSVLREHRILARFLRPEREQRIEQMIDRHGPKVFFFARFLVGLRSPIFLVAGILRIPFRRFILIDSLCATCVIGVVFGLSYRYAEQIEQLLKWIQGGQLTLTVLIVAAVVTVVVVYWRRRQRRWERVRLRRLKRTSRVTSPE